MTSNELAEVVIPKFIRCFDCINWDNNSCKIKKNYTIKNKKSFRQCKDGRVYLKIIHWYKLLVERLRNNRSLNDVITKIQKYYLVFLNEKGDEER